MPRVGFEPTIPAFERTTTVHVLDRAATVIGCDEIRKEMFFASVLMEPTPEVRDLIHRAMTTVDIETSDYISNYATD
jgi:hypothetical protein